jgi:hypothetical protein
VPGVIRAKVTAVGKLRAKKNTEAQNAAYKVTNAAQNAAAGPRNLAVKKAKAAAAAAAAAAVGEVEGSKTSGAAQRKRKRKVLQDLVLSRWCGAELLSCCAAELLSCWAAAELLPC